MEKMENVSEKNLKILEGELDVLDSVMNMAFKDPFVRPSSMIYILFLREMQSKKCADLYSRISKSGRI